MALCDAIACVFLLSIAPPYGMSILHSYHLPTYRVLCQDASRTCCIFRYNHTTLSTAVKYIFCFDKKKKRLNYCI